MYVVCLRDVCYCRIHVRGAKTTIGFRAPFHRPLNDEYRNPIKITYQVKKEGRLISQSSTNRYNPSFAATPHARPIVVSQLRTTLFIRADNPPGHFSVPQERFHPIHLISWGEEMTGRAIVRTYRFDEVPRTPRVHQNRWHRHKGRRLRGIRRKAGGSQGSQIWVGIQLGGDTIGVHKSTNARRDWFLLLLDFGLFHRHRRRKRFGRSTPEARSSIEVRKLGRCAAGGSSSGSSAERFPRGERVRWCGGRWTKLSMVKHMFSSCKLLSPRRGRVIVSCLSVDGVNYPPASSTTNPTMRAGTRG